MNNTSSSRSVKVGLAIGRDNSVRYVLGRYHPNVKTIYLMESQVKDILNKTKLPMSLIRPVNNIAQVKIIRHDRETGKTITTKWGV